MLPVPPPSAKTRDPVPHTALRRTSGVALTAAFVTVTPAANMPRASAADTPSLRVLTYNRRVVVRVRVRRLVCPTPDCRHTFREQIPGLLEHYQRRTARLTSQVKAVVKELAGRAGSRGLSALTVCLSRHTALRALLRIPGAGSVGGGGGWGFRPIGGRMRQWRT
jgi:hypothetical protein